MEVTSFTVNFSPDHLGSTLRFDLFQFSNRTAVTLKCDGVKDRDFTSLLHNWGLFVKHLEDECFLFLTGEELKKLRRLLEFTLDETNGF